MYISNQRHLQKTFVQITNQDNRAKIVKCNCDSFEHIGSTLAINQFHAIQHEWFNILFPFNLFSLINIHGHLNSYNINESTEYDMHYRLIICRVRCESRKNQCSPVFFLSFFVGNERARSKKYLFVTFDISFNRKHYVLICKNIALSLIMAIFTLEIQPGSWRRT